MKNLLERVLIAAIFIPLLTYIVLAGDLLLLLFVEVVIGVSLYEFYTMTSKKGLNVFRNLGIGFGLLIPLLYYYELTYGTKGVSLVAMVTSGLILYFITRQVIIGEIKETFQKISYTIFGIFYISFLFSHFLQLKYVSVENVKFLGYEFAEGRLWLLATLLMIWSADSAAYFIGKRFGSKKLSAISPKKSVEGAIAGYFAPILSLLILSQVWFPDLGLVNIFFIGSIVGVFGAIGDLGESLFKREFAAKDSGTVLLGHGGMLDRFDSLLFVTPLIFYYLKLFVI